MDMQELKEIPNEETQQAIKEARIGKNMETISIEKLKKFTKIKKKNGKN